MTKKNKFEKGDSSLSNKKLKKVKLNKKVKVGKKAFLFTKVKGQKTT